MFCKILYIIWLMLVLVMSISLLMWRIMKDLEKLSLFNIFIRIWVRLSMW